MTPGGRGMTRPRLSRRRRALALKSVQRRAACRRSISMPRYFLFTPTSLHSNKPQPQQMCVPPAEVSAMRRVHLTQSLHTHITPAPHPIHSYFALHTNSHPMHNHSRCASRLPRCRSCAEST
eukprot:scaffold457_cov111-Isochrysis_galbana.AAC.2